MFLATIARPRFDSQKNELSLEKSVYGPFSHKSQLRGIVLNRVGGTIETKPITSVNIQVLKMCLLGNVLPAMMEKWPIEDRGHPIFIQQDNARSHVAPDDEDFRRVASQDGFDIRLMCQPPNSPD